jgi:hypothetical protein
MSPEFVRYVKELRGRYEYDINQLRVILNGNDIPSWRVYIIHNQIERCFGGIKACDDILFAIEHGLGEEK